MFYITDLKVMLLLYTLVWIYNLSEGWINLDHERCLRTENVWVFHFEKNISNAWLNLDTDIGSHGNLS
jgi:hypothetical protein